MFPDVLMQVEEKGKGKMEKGRSGARIDVVKGRAFACSPFFLFPFSFFHAPEAR
ncbi:MAG TPA: hypothetical protein VN259_17130 [Xanthomonadales bacterium]|nr:hypothetical protein [Xanthomonadales bacterium]